MPPTRVLAVLTGLVLLGAATPPTAARAMVGPGARDARRVAAATGLPTLVAIRAAHHRGYDRLVFEFRAGLPASRQVRYVRTVVADGSGMPVRLLGRAFLAVRFTPAAGHDDTGRGTFGPARHTPDLPTLRQLATAGDFEGVLSFGIGLRCRAPVHTFVLARPSRVVVDVAA